MEAEIGVEEVDTAEELMEESAEGRGGEWGADGLRMMVDDLLPISFAFEAEKCPHMRILTKKSCSAYSNTM